ncbi:PleD family two-component system response regulator [Treponema sp.]|uniref:response regulator n=1 Tax=Treponema sp. TaxID=166 RepID=UPI0025CED938|nr:response regulator [Treponema sp.]MCR5218964.1 response regulator [Treponema sp.]
MERRILFITDEPNFLVKAMIKSLEDANFKVQVADPDMVGIAHIENLPEIFMVYLDGNLNKFNGTLVYLKKLLTEDGKERILYLIGNSMELEEAYQTLPRNLVASSFKRPVNVREILTKLNMLVADDKASSTGKKKILVVDDDSVTLRTMKLWLSVDYDVYIVNSGMNAIKFLMQTPVDLILLDYEMPVVSGLQVFEMLKSDFNTKDIPVIFLTAKDDKETVMKVLAAKPEKYLLKSMEPDLLVKAVNDFFKGK